MTDEHLPVELLPSGAIKLHIDEDTIVWRPPRVRHMEDARNGHAEIAAAAQSGITDLREKIAAEDADPMSAVVGAGDADTAADKLSDDVRADCEAWVRARHAELVLSGELPGDVLDWPAWMPRISFVTECVRHWGGNPFGSKPGQ